MGSSKHTQKLSAINQTGCNPAMSKNYGSTGERDSLTAYNRPRRPNPDTIMYLRSLPLDVEAAKTEVSSFLETGEVSEDFPQSLGAALSAIDEVRNEIASLAGDEQGSQCLEILARISAPYSETAARVLLSACTGYHLHLATHRYGSHAVQSILQLAVSSSSDIDLGLHAEAPQFGRYLDSLPTLSDLILGMLDELSSSATELAVHICGSHVLRTLLCVLGGVDLVSSGLQGSKQNTQEANLRGRKKAKKKKNRPAALEDCSVPHTGTMNIVYRSKSRLATNEFSDQLASLARTLMGQETDVPGELQQLACHPSAGPLLIVLLRVLTYSSPEARAMMDTVSQDRNAGISDFRLGISRREPVFQDGSIAHEMAKRLLCWIDGKETQTQVGNVIYGYSGEPRGSHVLETLLRLSSDGMHDAIVRYGEFEDMSSLQEYCEHEVANFVIQTLLTTIRHKDQATRMLKAIDKVISGGLVVDPTKKRRGILWRCCELAAKFRIGQETLLKSIRIGFGTLIHQTVDVEKDGAVEAQKKKQRKKSSAVEIKDCIPLLLDLRNQIGDTTKATMDAAGARAVYHMLHFTPRLCEDILKGLLDELTVEQIESLARDGLGSRCILDGILDGPRNDPLFASAFVSLFSKLNGRWSTIATDRVGYHCVKKLFHALPKLDDKAKLAEELANGGNRLHGNPMGRSVSEECLVPLYVENRKEWRKAVTMSHNIKETKKADDVVPKSKDDNPNEQQSTHSKRQRKRKRVEKVNQPHQGGKNLDTASIVDALIF